MPTNTKALQVAEPVAQIAGKNAVINGGFDIWQRGTSFTSLGNVYTADRWVVYNTNGAGGYTASQQTSWLDGFNYSMRIQRNSGATGTASVYLAMCFESVNLVQFAGKTVTFSFYARKGADYSPTSSNLNVFLAISQSTNGTVFTAGTNELTKIDTNVVLTTSGTRYSFTFDVPTGYKSARIQISMTGVGTAGTNDWFEITGAQWELGSTATPFSRAGGTIQGELAACQRYYFRFGGDSTTQIYGNGIGESSSAVGVFVQFPIPMRTSPSSVDYSTLRVTDWATANFAITSVSIAGSNYGKNGAVVNCAVTGATAYRPYFLASANSSSGYIGFSAEL